MCRPAYPVCERRSKTMKRILHYHISSEGDTIQAFLKKQGYSRHVMIQLKKIKESVLVDGVWEHFSYILKPGELLTVQYKENICSEKIIPVQLPIDIIYEDEDIIVVNKAADMPVHPSMDNYDNTLANGLAWYYRERGEGFTCRFINRLDRDTTGLLLAAKHGISACILSEQMRKRQIVREYYAVVKGRCAPCGSICAPIARKKESLLVRCVDFEQGETARTHYKLLKYCEGYSLVALHLDTGRTHQIRVHMNYIGHPLPGDYLYHPDYSRISRQPLHSHGLSFYHPITGKYMQFYVEMPEDMKKF